MFIRELISNASDALEKLRHKLVSEGQTLPEMEIHLQTDAEKGTITIQVPPPVSSQAARIPASRAGVSTSHRGEQAGPMGSSPLHTLGQRRWNCHFVTSLGPK